LLRKINEPDDQEKELDREDTEDALEHDERLHIHRIDHLGRGEKSHKDRCPITANETLRNYGTNHYGTPTTGTAGHTQGVVQPQRARNSSRLEL
jgi:hypothetical protein